MVKWNDAVVAYFKYIVSPGFTVYWLYSVINMYRRQSKIAYMVSLSESMINAYYCM